MEHAETKTAPRCEAGALASVARGPSLWSSLPCPLEEPGLQESVAPPCSGMEVDKMVTAVTDTLERFELRLTQLLDQWADRHLFERVVLATHSRKARHHSLLHGAAAFAHATRSSSKVVAPADSGQGTSSRIPASPDVLPDEVPSLGFTPATVANGGIQDHARGFSSHESSLSRTNIGNAMGKLRAKLSSYSMENLRMQHIARRHSVARARLGGPKRKEREPNILEKLVTGPAFEAGLAVVISLSAAWIGMQVEYEAQHLGEGQPVAFFAVDCVFTGVFLVELILRVVALRCSLLAKHGIFWSCLDTVLVLSSIVETAVQALVQIEKSKTPTSTGITQLRLLRVFRIARVARALRLTRLIRFVASLRTLVTSIFATLHSLVWALLLLLIMIYATAVIFTQSTNDFLSEVGEFDQDAGMQHFWGTLPLAMSTLFQCITGGVSWGDAMKPLLPISWALVSLMFVYIFFTTFAVMNVLTGVFCQTAIETVGRDTDLATQAMLERKKSYGIAVQRVFESLDSDGSGQISLMQLESRLSDPQAQAQLAAIGVDVQNAWSVFKLMDVNGSGSVDRDEFVSGVLRVQGQATSFDLQEMMEAQRWMSHQLSKITSTPEQVLRKQPGEESE